MIGIVPGGVAVERDAQRDEGRHRERVVLAADPDDELGRHEAVDDGADADADDDPLPDPPDDVERGAPGVADPVLERRAGRRSTTLPARIFQT